MAKEAANLAIQLQSSLENAFPGIASPYQQVSALILYWMEDDFNPSCAKESRQVVEIFENDFYYKVEVFPIPTFNSWNLLQQAVVNFKCSNDGHSNLLIVYYSGHADSDQQRGKAVWAA
jgi:hypothetical protein